MSWMQAIELFQADEALVPTVPARESLAPGAMLLRGWAEPDAVALLADLQGALERGRGGVQRLRTRRVPGESLRTRRPADAAPGSQRA
jgi:hypothetical protein